MNANELADEIQQISNRTVNLSDKVIIAHAGLKLRQQQAEIEALHLELDETHKRMILQQDEIEVNKYGYELGLNIKIEELKEKDVCLKLLHDRIAHLNKMVVYYQDISMSGTHSEEYEEGFWDAVDFVKKVQER